MAAADTAAADGAAGGGGWGGGGGYGGGGGGGTRAAIMRPPTRRLMARWDIPTTAPSITAAPATTMPTTATGITAAGTIIGSIPGTAARSAGSASASALAWASGRLGRPVVLGLLALLQPVLHRGDRRREHADRLLAADRRGRAGGTDERRVGRPVRGPGPGGAYLDAARSAFTRGDYQTAMTQVEPGHCQASQRRPAARVPRAGAVRHPAVQAGRGGDLRRAVGRSRLGLAHA